MTVVDRSSEPDAVFEARMAEFEAGQPVTADPLRDHLDQLAATHAAAAAGPWALNPVDGHYVIGEVVEGDDGLEYLDVADTGGRSPGYPTSADADAAAIVAEHNAFDGLLSVVRGLADLADEWQQMADDAREGADYEHGDWLQTAAARIRAVLSRLTPEGDTR